MSRSKVLVIVCLSLLVISCNKVPRYVIQPDDMAALLADMHVAESVVEVNRADYRTDSTKQLMKQSVLQKHGYTQEQLDTSFQWYGHNITYYMDVYDKTIEILEHRLSETGNRIAAENISIAGDSVDVWTMSNSLVINQLSPTQIITFYLDADENWEKGDSYVWRAKFSNNSNPSTWGIVAGYKDGSSEYFIDDLSGDGWREIRFATDSSKIATHYYGFMNIEPKPSTSVVIDSIMLIRNRLIPDNYKKHYRQHKFMPKNELTDSIEE